MPVSVLKVGICPSLSACESEAKYVLRTLARIAGYATDLRWAGGAGSDSPKQWDIYYGPAAADTVRARVRIDARTDLTRLTGREPRTFREMDGLGFIAFEEEADGFERSSEGEGELRFRNDIVAACYWLLTGAREQSYPRDRHGSASLNGSFLQRHGLLSRPLVSEYATFLRETFRRLGAIPLPLPWSDGSAAAFSFSHDVDYPQMIRWIEAARLTRMRGLRGLRALGGVLSGTNNFWKFDDWMAFESRFGARPAFYFSARKGSLWQYARGTPDCFYDVHSAEFRELFARLRGAGCEIGLHASYNAYRSVTQLAAERETLQQASGASVEGNRHHYFRLDPTAPHETLARHEEAGLAYDSSLAFAYYPGFRRGVCHPYHVFHPGERRELGILQIPVAWMDDHFHRCLTKNGITDIEGTAAGLLDAARRTGGVATVDYHVRGMNEDFFPQYGPWLERFAERHLDSSLAYLTPGDVSQRYAAYERQLDAASRDGTSTRTVSLGAGCTVALLQPHEHAAWEAFVEGHPDATIYHTLAWRRVTEEGLGHNGQYLRAMNRAGEIVGVLPLFAVNSLGGRVLVSVPLRDRGGPLARDAAVASALVAAARDLTREVGARSVAIKYPADGLASVLAAAGFAEEKHWVTTVVPVGMGEDKLWNDVFRSPTRRAINKARNSGLEPRWSEDEADLERFYHVFLMTRRKLGVPAYPRGFFLAIWRHLHPKGHVRLLLVEKEGRTLGALLIMPYKREVISAYMGSDPEAKDARVNDLLFWEAIRWCATSGFASFYFGADSPLQEGLLAYKRKWGGEQFTIPNYFYSANGAAHHSTDSSSPQYARTRKAISMMPVPLFRAFSSWATRRLW